MSRLNTNGFAARIAMVLLALGLAGCATAKRNAADSLESYNRTMFAFNDKVDQAVLKPTAELYQATLPQFVQIGIGNFFGNLSDVPTMANQFLQGKFAEGLNDFMRVAVNSTLGLGGILDIASEAGLPKHDEDFGQTLGRWGVRPGPYFVLPLFGPSTVRDALALPIDIKSDPWRQFEPEAHRRWGTVVKVVDQRAVALNASNLLEEAALDRYEFVRDAFLQRRESRVFDGEAPRRQRTSLDDDAGSGIAAVPRTGPVAAETVSGSNMAEPQAGMVVKEEQQAGDAMSPAAPVPPAAIDPAPKVTYTPAAAPR